jgi:hypothetical protein
VYTNACPTPGAAELEQGGNAVVAFHPHSDYLFGEAPTRERNVAGYLIRTCESTPQSEPGGQSEKNGGNISTVPTHGWLDLVRIGKFFVPPNFDLASRFVSPTNILFFSGASCTEGDGHTPRQLPIVPADGELWRSSPRASRPPSAISLFSSPSVSHPSSYRTSCHLMSAPDTPGSRLKNPTTSAGSLDLRRSLPARSAILDFQRS